MGMAEDIKARIDEIAKNAEIKASKQEPYIPPKAIEPKEIEDIGDDGKPNGKKLVVDAHSGWHDGEEAAKIFGPRKHPPNLTRSGRFEGGSGESRLESK